MDKTKKINRSVILFFILLVVNYSLVRLQRSHDVKDVDQKQNTKRPYTFHIGASWSRKSSLFVGRNGPSHPSDKWRERMLTTHTRRVTPEKKDPGDDFFFIQEVNNSPSCLPLYVSYAGSN